MKKRLKKITRYEWLVFLVLIGLAALLRFWALDRLAFFTYDQARDVLYIKRILIDHKLRLIGTQSSIPGLYNGPFYYYLMVPFLWLARLNPIGLDWAAAFFGVLAVGMFYLLARRLFKSRLLAAALSFLFAVQPQLVAQSRFAWNPNLTPFFFLVFLWGMVDLTDKKPRGWLISLVSLAILIQLHYSAAVLFPAFLIFVVLKRKVLVFQKSFRWGMVGFIVLLAPLLFFELRHHFLNTRSILKYLREGAPSQIPPPPLSQALIDNYSYLLAKIPFGLDRTFGLLTALATGLTGGFLAIREKKKTPAALIVLFGLGVIFLSVFYRGSHFTYHLTLFYPLGFLLLGYLVNRFSIGRLSWGLAGLFLVGLTAGFFRSSLALFTADRGPGGLPPKYHAVAALISQDLEQSPDTGPYNLVGLVGGDRFDHNAVDYRYFLETYYGKKFLDWDVLDYQKARTVYFISELGDLDIRALGIWELETFGEGKIAHIWEVSPEIYVYKIVK